jgi:hypothetical protein
MQDEAEFKERDPSYKMIMAARTNTTAAAAFRKVNLLASSRTIELGH